MEGAVKALKSVIAEASEDDEKAKKSRKAHIIKIIFKE